MHAVAAGEVHPLFARAGFVGSDVGRGRPLTAGEVNALLDLLQRKQRRDAAK